MFDNEIYNFIYAFIIVVLFFVLIIIFAIDNSASRKERAMIINNEKENVVKYDLEHCEKIEDYYYCWSEE